MTVDPARLLQMLEPAVRPGAAAPGGAQPGNKPFEAKSFEQLLGEATQAKESTPTEAVANPAKANPLGGLSGLDQIENAALRRVLTQSGNAGMGSGPQGV